MLQVFVRQMICKPKPIERASLEIRASLRVSHDQESGRGIQGQLGACARNVFILNQKTNERQINLQCM